MTLNIGRIVEWFGAGLFVGFLGWGLARVGALYTRFLR